MEKKFLHDCKGKHLTLGEMSEALKKVEKSLEIAKNNKGNHNRFRNKKPQTTGNTASIKPSEAGAHEEDPEKFHSSYEQERQERPD